MIRRVRRDAPPIFAYERLVQMLYDIGFLGYNLGKKNPDVFSHDEPDIIDQRNTIRQADAFVVHPRSTWRSTCCS